jgi:hypothetical protein
MYGTMTFGQYLQTFRKIIVPSFKDKHSKGTVNQQTRGSIPEGLNPHRINSFFNLSPQQVIHPHICKFRKPEEHLNSISSSVPL